MRSCRCLLFQRWRSEVHSLPQWLDGCWRFLEAPGENQAPLPALTGCSRVDAAADGQRQVPGAGVLSRREAVLPVGQQQGETCSFQNITMSFENAVTRVVLTV